MIRSKASLLAWTLFVIVTVATLFEFVNQQSAGSNLFEAAGNLLWGLIGIEFAFLAALILSYQPHNVIGWLMMSPVIMYLLNSATTYILQQFPTAPAMATAPLLFALWFDNVGFILLIFPLLFTMLLFPNGRPPSPRWRWALIAGLGMAVFSIFYTLFQPAFTLFGDDDWIMANPIGFLPADLALLEMLSGAFLVVLTLVCLAAPFVRFRHATGMERSQIKWLFYSCVLFVIAFPLAIMMPEEADQNILFDFLALLLPLSVVAVPAAIAIAILRYRLYDIDVIIRKTLVYGLLTGLLLLIYFGSAVLLQALVEALTGQGSPIIIVVSTLLIAALFTPLRRRVQRAIDRRFYRQKYDAQRVLAQFAETARDEVELEALTAELARVTRETVQPESITLWLREHRS